MAAPGSGKLSIRRIVHQRRARRARTQTGVRRALRWLLFIALSFAGLNLLGALAGVGTVVSVYAYYAQRLPEPGEITRVEQEFETTRLYDRTGEHLLYEVIDPLGGDRIWVELPDIPIHLRQATIAAEDRTFYENPGYDLEGILRALWNNLTGGQVQGGSSITQQLVKNVLIEPEKRTELSLDRKIQELILAIRISNEYSKDQILEWYLNTNFYGNLAYGVEAAAQVYFGKSVGELSLAEAAMLAAIPQSPGLNPIDNFALAKERQRLVLDAMVEEGYITQDEADIAFETPLEIRPPEQRFNLLAPHFSIAARKQLEDMFGPDLVYRGGLVVYTTLDYDLYLQLECAARSHVARLSGQPETTVIPAADGSDCEAARYLYPLPPEHRQQDHNVSNAAVVVLNAPTGEVLAMMGSLDYYDPEIDGNFNVALALRQPGSAFKPFTYVTAFEQGYTPATMTLDVRTAFDVGSNQPYVPENFDRQFHGPQSIRSALANSYNVPAVQVLDWVGIDNVIRTAHAMGINTLDRGLDYYGLSLTLGGGEVTLYDMTYAYSVFANMGEMRGRPTPQDRRRPGFRTLDPTLILRVEDREGNILWEYGQGNTFSSNRILEPSLAYLINDILSDEVARRPSVGPESALLLSRPAAVKTGTTNDYRDNWTIGYTPQIVTGVWVGNTDNSPMVDLPAIVGAAPIWHAIMEYAHRDLPVETWERPPDIVEMTVCQTSGLLPTPYCPTRQEIFRQGTEPTTYDTIYQPFLVNRETGLLATVYTPPDLVEERVYMVLPPEAADWVREAGIPQPPTEYDTVLAPEAFGDVAITDPAPFAYVRGAITIRGNARDPNFQLYRLDYGQGLNPTSWTQIGQNSFTPRYNDELGIWDTRLLDGLYSLRLTVVRGDNSINEFVIQVTVDNIPPSIELAYPEDGQQYTLDDEFVTIQPFVSDNISMDRVEFYVDDQLIAISTVAPFNERWIITEAGTHVIQLRAYDTAGNTALSERVTIEVLAD
ncbi:MAG TPA: penicillin-binding protein [Chloroflexi bacterium]|nr:penicillin-binding protein [Chloroflexota bacterium]